MRHTKAYIDYLQSDAWKARRRSAIRNAGGRCQNCGKSYPSLEVHHKHYETLGSEHRADLKVLCPLCHKKADQQRAYETRYERGLNTFMTKKYGENWYDRFSDGEAETVFDLWLEKKEAEYE